MLIHPTLDQLRSLRLEGMAKALQEQLDAEGLDTWSFEDRLALLIDRESTHRDQRRLALRLRKAKLRHRNACIEDLDFRTKQGLDRRFVLELAGCEWLRLHRNLLITGATGSGKTYLACALAQKACREGYTALYTRLPRLLEDLRIAHGDGRYPKLMASLAKIDLLILDDWGMVPIGDADRRELLEILEDRYELKSTLVASQVSRDQWYDYLGHPVLADAILDRLVHNAYSLELQGKESMRKLRAAKADQPRRPAKGGNPEGTKGAKAGGGDS